MHVKPQLEMKGQKDMSTQNERELARDRLADAIGGDAFDCTRTWSAWGVGTMSEDDFVPIINDDNRLNEILDHVCAPLLSRIAELEAEAKELASVIRQQDERIDALSKDAKRLDWMIFHSAAVLHTSDAEHCSVKWGNNQTDLYDSAREAIDAAISAREGQ